MAVSGALSFRREDANRKWKVVSEWEKRFGKVGRSPEYDEEIWETEIAVHSPKAWNWCLSLCDGQGIPPGQ